jgi:hypothetical protein
MINYRVIEQDKMYGVYETQTGHVVYKNKDRISVSERCRWLNLGGSFDGWTPGYLLTATHKTHLTPEDVNFIFEDFLLGEES